MQIPGGIYHVITRGLKRVVIFKDRGCCSNDQLTCVNWFEALEIIAVWQPDVIITDYAMPGITGIQVIQKIKNRKLSNIKIILYSACLTTEIKREAKALGVVACVDKPFDVAELKRLISE